MAKKARVWTGTEFVELASAQTDLTAYSTTAQMNTAIAAAPSGLTLISTITFSAAATINVNNVFTSAFANYFVILNQTAITGSGSYQMRLRAGTDNTASNYNFFTERRSSLDAAAIVANNRSQNIAQLTTGSPGNFFKLTFEVNSPNLSAHTSGNITYCDDVANSGNGAYIFTNTTVFDGFSLIPVPSTSVTGILRIYGLEN